MHTCRNPSQALCSNGSTTAVTIFLSAVWCPFTEDTCSFQVFTSFPFCFHQVRSAARKRWHRWQDHHSLRVRVARAMSIPTSPTRISFHSIKQTAAVWYTLHIYAPPGGLQGSFSSLPRPLSSDFLPLLRTALFRNEVPIIFLWTPISRVHDAALRQPGKSLLE